MFWDSFLGGCLTSFILIFPIAKKKPEAEWVKPFLVCAGTSFIRVWRYELENYCDAYPCKLSGGQKQRAAIACTLAMKPEIILFDEPTSAFDSELAGGVLKIIKNLVLEKNRTMIVVTHKIKFAKEVATRIIFIESGKVLEHDLSKEIFCFPKSPRLEKFLSYL